MRFDFIYWLKKKTRKIRVTCQCSSRCHIICIALLKQLYELLYNESDIEFSAHSDSEFVPKEAESDTIDCTDNAVLRN